jgi:AcrR family transcriptional regulator
MTQVMASRSNNVAVYARGEETRSRILAVAIRLFAQDGFDSVTTRMIAAEARVPAPSLRYYFENKQGLYAACLTAIREKLLAAMEPALASAERLIARDDVDRTLLIDAFCTLQGAYFDHMLTRPNSQTIAHFIARHDLAASLDKSRQPTGNGASAYRMVTCFVRLVMRISGETLDWQSALLVAGMVNGQIEPLIAKRSGLEDVGVTFTAERMEWLKRSIRQQTIASLLLHCP